MILSGSILRNVLPTVSRMKSGAWTEIDCEASSLYLPVMSSCPPVTVCPSPVPEPVIVIFCEPVIVIVSLPLTEWVRSPVTDSD